MLDEKLMKEVVRNGEYFDRTIDSFKHVGPDIFSRLYKKRMVSILLDPIPTNMLNSINEYLITSREENLMLGNFSPVEIYLNTYPYDLSVDVLDRLLLILRKYVPDFAKIRLINMKFPDVKWVNDNVGLMIMYDGIDWLQRVTNDKSLLKTPIPDVGLMFPKIVFKNTKREDFNNYFKQLDEISGILIKLNPIHIKNFSLVNEQ